MLTHLFSFIRGLYAQPGVGASNLATDQPHFYTMVTSIHALGLIDKYGAGELRRKLIVLSRIIDAKTPPPKGMAKGRRNIN